MGDLQNLAGRVKAASGPDRELDEAIAGTLGFHLVAQDWPEQAQWYSADGVRTPHRANDPGFPPPFTASIDAALTLVPEGHWCATVTHCPGQKAEASLIQFELRDGKYWHGKHLIDTGRVKASTPALAIVSAALKALDNARTS